MACRSGDIAVSGESRRKVAVVTGTRAEWGLLSPVCDAIIARGDLALEVCAGGAHLLDPPRTSDPIYGHLPGFEPTIIWVESCGHHPHRFEMQRAGETGRPADAAALGRGVSALAEHFARLAPDIVVVLGDRIEAFAAASAASIGGIRVAHIHGGDRAEGVADEAMRHAITKLSHIHFAASAESAARIARLGEDAARIHLVGSPAVDGLDGWHTLRDGVFDLVVSDIDMPRMNGIEFVRTLRGDARFATVPVIVVSYKDREADRLAGLEAGATAYLTKGAFQDSTFADTVRDLVHGLDDIERGEKVEEGR